MANAAQTLNGLGMASVCRPVTGGSRPRAVGKFLFVEKEKLLVRGVTYGTFRPNQDGDLFPQPAVVDADFAMMAESGINAIRTYTVPPPWLLDLAQKRGLWIMIGLGWEQHITFLDDKKRTHSIRERVVAGVRACSGHPAVLCYTLGNEIPAPIVRWHGRRPIERFVEDLYHRAKAEDPAGLFTYVNYPTTEYLQLPFLDLCAFNVYLESEERLEAYLGRVQNLAGERPLLMAEIGLDSRRNGEFQQASALEWQIRTAFRCGCAGAFVFAWTDEWFRGGYAIEDWDFGLVTRSRDPKPALHSVSRAFTESPLPPQTDWPRISVVVCSCNGARTLRECCQALSMLTYPELEIIVINDGSTDKTEAIAREHGFRVISTARQGLSSARNTGMKAACGDIVAYIDDDAYPDPDWLYYLALTFQRTNHVGVGGPNIPPPGDGLIADCVSNAPGGPVHVLLSDTEAEHIPGCNMAFRKSALEQIGGFDVQFRTAGDDVDVCWRLRERGWSLGFNPGAVVWHHRRNSLRGYLRQQKGYGKAEALLAAKWPEKYNSAGHVNWAGRIYGNGLTRMLGVVERVYHGFGCTAPFQSLYERVPGMAHLPLMPEWLLIVTALGLLSALGLSWKPLLMLTPLFVGALAVMIAQAWASARRSHFSTSSLSHWKRLALRTVVAALHLLQPIARLTGRLGHGLTPWRRNGSAGFSIPWRKNLQIWSEHPQNSAEVLQVLQDKLRELGYVAKRGGEFDRWDLEVGGGAFGAVRLLLALEEHGGGKQMIRVRAWPRWKRPSMLSFIAAAAISSGAALGHSPLAFIALGAIALEILVHTAKECGGATAAVQGALTQKAELSVKRAPMQPVRYVERQAVPVVSLASVAARMGRHRIEPGGD